MAATIDTDTIDPPHAVLTVRGWFGAERELVIRAVPVVRLPAWMRAVGPVLALIDLLDSAPTQPSRAQRRRALKQVDTHAIQALGLCCDWPAAALRRLPPAVQWAALWAMVALNQDALDLVRTAQRGDLPEPTLAEQQRQRTAWSDAVQRLLAAGHTRADIDAMSLAQCRAYLDAAERADARDLAAAIIAASYSMAKPDAIRRAVRTLQSPARR